MSLINRPRLDRPGNNVRATKVCYRCLREHIGLHATCDGALAALDRSLYNCPCWKESPTLPAKLWQRVVKIWCKA